MILCLFFLANAFCIDETKVAVSGMVLQFLPGHGNSKRKALTFPFRPVTQYFFTLMTHSIWDLFLVLVTVMGTYPTIPQRWTRPTEAYSPSLARSAETTSSSLRDI